MNPFDYMSKPFIDANQEALDEALFDKVVHAPDSLGECLQYGMQHIGEGIAWFGFWIAVGLIGFGGLK